MNMFIAPEIEVVKFAVEDIITTSGDSGTGGDSGIGGDTDFGGGTWE